MARRSASALEAAPQVAAAQEMAAASHSVLVPVQSPEDMAAAAASAAGLMSAPQAQFSPSSQLGGKESFYQRKMQLQRAHAKPVAHSDTRRAEKVFAGGASLATYVRTADWRNNEETPPEASSAP